MTSAGSLEWLIDEPTIACIVVSPCTDSPLTNELLTAAQQQTADFATSITTAVEAHERAAEF